MNPKTLIEAAFNSETNRASPTDGSFFADPFFIWSIVDFNFGAQIPDLSYFYQNYQIFIFGMKQFNLLVQKLESKRRSKITRLVNWSNFVSQTFENNEFFFGKFFLLILRLF